MKHRILAIAFLLSTILLSCQVRKPAVAGMWYPDNPDELTNMLDGFFANADLPDSLRSIKLCGILSPHAGYVYSGQVAAYGYSLVSPGDFDTVILLGSSHHYLEDIVSIYDCDSYSTPLGEVPIDNDIFKSIISADKRFVSQPKLHLKEHSNDAQLPFLQHRLNDFRIVPVITSTRDKKLLKKLSSAIIEAIRQSGKRVLIVESSDMSHYHDYRTAMNMDRRTIDLITGKDWEQLGRAIENGDCELCGYSSLMVFIDIMKYYGAEESALLKYANSGDAVGDTSSSRVVGYSSIVFYQKKQEEHSMNDKQREYLLKLARTSIETYMKTGKKHNPERPDDQELCAERAVFVTLNKGQNLRGCIGQMIAREPLYQAVNNMAFSAAFHDPRFSQVTSAELDRITIEISVLSPMQRISDWQSIRLGTDGVWVRKGYASGVYLPQVATETGWDLPTFLGSLCAHKAGISPDAFKDPDTEIYIFQVDKFSEVEQ